MRSRQEQAKKPDRHGKGKIIIMWLLFMPLFAIGVTCGYAMFNKNAYQSTTATEVTSQIEVNLSSGIVAGNKYTISYRNSIGVTGAKIHYDEISINWADYGANANYNYNRFYIQKNNKETTIYLYIDTGAPTYTLTNVWGNTLSEFTFKSAESQTIGQEAPIYLFMVNTDTYKLDNVFYYSIDKVQESSLFNWANNNIIYTGMHSMCTTINITSTFIPFILTYWILISIIYMLFDIEFTLLWKLHEKIHDLTESI